MSANTDRIHVNFHGNYDHCFPNRNILYITGLLKAKSNQVICLIVQANVPSSEQHARCLFQQVLGTNLRTTVMPLNLLNLVSSNFPPTGKF
jgi:hypothetical protein